ncbi:hypothetical protein F4806DRAFT_461607 [Annulohypoxylon nitens]|nr:hypothetical protein F4806DRAFT_461607 [Annulohypoxylon nitens]
MSSYWCLKMACRTQPGIQTPSTSYARLFVRQILLHLSWGLFILEASVWAWVHPLLTPFELARDFQIRKTSALLRPTHLLHKYLPTELRCRHYLPEMVLETVESYRLRQEVLEAYLKKLFGIIVPCTQRAGEYNFHISRHLTKIERNFIMDNLRD